MLLQYQHGFFLTPRTGVLLRNSWLISRIVHRLPRHPIT